MTCKSPARCAGTASAFLGTQGDEWDAQKDMSLAFGGALLALALTALYRARTGHEPWRLGAG